jgi:hypothetical protein
MRKMSALLCVMLLISIGAFARKEKADHIHFDIDTDWKFASQSEIPGADITEWVRLRTGALRVCLSGGNQSCSSDLVHC